MIARKITAEEISIVRDVLSAFSARFHELFPDANCCIVEVRAHGYKDSRAGNYISGFEWHVSHHSNTGCEIATGNNPEGALESMVRQLKPKGERARLMREEGERLIAQAKLVEEELKKGGAS